MFFCSMLIQPGFSGAVSWVEDAGLGWAAVQKRLISLSARKKPAKKPHFACQIIVEIW